MTSYFKTSAIAAAIMLTITGCSVTDSAITNSSVEASSSNALTMKNQQILKLNQEIQEKNRQKF